MYPQPKVIKVKPGSELALLLEEADQAPLLLEKDGVLYHLTASDQEDIWADYDPKRVKVGLKKSAEALSDVDTEQLLDDIHQSREQRSNRPS